jgi:FkbM family methyltransferase
MQTGIGRNYREPSWLERVGSGSASHAPAWLRRLLKRAYNTLLAALPGDHLVCRLPGGETLRVDPDYRHLAWNAEEYTALKHHARAGATILDVGANVGCYTMLFAGWVGDSGHVYAFEPAAESRAGLERHLSINGLSTRVTVRPEAITDRSGVAPFIDAGTHGDNRLVPPATSGTTNVPAQSIDEFCEAAALSPDVIKIDIEGAELAALRGARRTIAARGAALALFVELHPAIWPSLGVTRADIEAELLRQRLVVEPLPGVGDPWAVEGVCVRVRPA